MGILQPAAGKPRQHPEPGAPALGARSGWCSGHFCSDAPGAKNNAPCFSGFIFKEKAKFPFTLFVCPLADAGSEARR